MNKPVSYNFSYFYEFRCLFVLFSTQLICHHWWFSGCVPFLYIECSLLESQFSAHFPNNILLKIMPNLCPFIHSFISGISSVFFFCFVNYFCPPTHVLPLILCWVTGAAVSADTLSPYTSSTEGLPRSSQTSREI